MAIDDGFGGTGPRAAEEPDTLERALVELREANERLITAGVKMQELAEEGQKARDEAQAASQAKDEFLARLSHELRTPLNAILGWTHLLRRTAGNDPMAQRAVDTIERNAKQQSQLIADLLQVSQIVTGQVQLQLEPVELGPVLHAGIDALRPAADAKRIKLESHVEQGVGPVLGDATKVQQIISNLLSNAIKFTPPDGRIDLSVKGVDSSAELSIQDSGIGIEPALLPHIFERFRQGNTPARRTSGGLGLGLGLAIVRQLMALHGGTVQAESSGLGYGSTFTLRFPVPALIASRERIGPVKVQTSLEGFRILVVEDDDDSRALMDVLLKAHGADVTTVCCARDAVTHLCEHSPDLLLSDIGLPDYDGYELMRQVRNMKGRDHSKLLAVALTAYAQPADRDHAFAAGFQLHIAKPIDPPAFIDAIGGLLATPWPHRPAQRPA